MVKIRDDIFPNLMGIFNESREKVLDVWIEEAFNPFSNRFSSLEEFVNFINKIKEPKRIWINLFSFSGFTPPRLGL